MHSTSRRLPRPMSVGPRALAAMAALAVAAPVAAAAQSGPEVLRTAMERYAERHEGIENYTVVQSVMGFETATYFEPDTIDGRVVFMPRSTTGSDAAQRVPESPWASFAQMEERAEHVGSETVDGVQAHVVENTDLEGIDVWSPGAAGTEFQPETLRLLIGEDDYLIREMRMTGSVTAQGGPQDVTFTARFSDYREVDGLTHPFRSEINVEGLQSRLSEEEMASMREMMEQMENMPEAQRQMMRQMMGDQFEQIERMMTEGTMDLTVEVTEVRVNAGPPGNG